MTASLYEILPVTLLTSVKAPSPFLHPQHRDAPASGGETASFRVPDTGVDDARPRGSGFMSALLARRDAEVFAGRGAVATPAASERSASARHRYSIKSSACSDVLRRAISGIDGYLSYCCGVKPFSRDERCLLRYAATSSPGVIRLSDGTVLAPGDLVIDLHLWNEHIPPVPKQGPDLAWARLVAQWMKHSVALLAEAVETHPELCGAKAVRAKTNFVGWGGHSESMSRLIERFGFEDVDEGASSIPERVHDAFENILIGALTWTHNPEALRCTKLIRQRRPVWMSVERLCDRHRRG